MTKGQFRTRVIQEAYRAKGETIYPVADTAKLDELIAEQLDELAGWTLAIPISAAAITLVAGTATYDIQASSLARRMASVLDVWLEGRVLLNFDSKPGPIDVLDIDRLDPDWQTRQGRPLRWWNEGVNSIRLYPIPESVLACTVSGFGLPIHPVSDSSQMDWPRELTEMAILYCAWMFIGRGSGYAADPKVADLGEIAMAQARAAKENAEARMLMRRIRGGRRANVGRMGEY